MTDDYDSIWPGKMEEKVGGNMKQLEIPSNYAPILHEEREGEC